MKWIGGPNLAHGLVFDTCIIGEKGVRVWTTCYITGCGFTAENQIKLGTCYMRLVVLYAPNTN